MNCLADAPGRVEELMRLDKLSRLVVSYFLKHISVGEIVAVMDLREEVRRRVREGEKDLVQENESVFIEREVMRVLMELVRKGVLYYRNGVYSLSPWLIELVKKRFGGLNPGVPKPLEKLVE
ncbi:PolB1-binding protein PBP2 family protein [Desulfurococcus mucosus]|uniref:PolB1-binding protein PBP2 family protein n=1 Tax=Desulfurococcus mucosus TaxID=2275 RepID=UPI003CCAE214